MYYIHEQIIHTIPEGRFSYMLHDLCGGHLPRQLIVSFVAHDSFNNDLKKNGYIFENLKINVSMTFNIFVIS